MNGQSKCPIHLSSHIRHSARVGATICHLGTKEGRFGNRGHFESFYANWRMH